MKNQLITVLRLPYNSFAIGLTILMYIVMSSSYSAVGNYDPITFSYSLMILISALGLIFKKDKKVQTYSFATLLLSFINAPMIKSISFFNVLGIFFNAVCFFLFFVYLKELYLSGVAELENNSSSTQV